MKVQNYKSVQNWFIKAKGGRGYAPSTERNYIGRMEIFCKLTGKTPDMLALADMGKMRDIIAVGLRVQYHRSIRSVSQWINTLNSFWKYNGRQLEGKYYGIREHLRKDIIRLKRWMPDS